MAASFRVDGAAELPQPYDEPIAPAPDIPPDELLNSIAGEYWFLGGAGGWHTELHLNADGTFTGRHEDADAGVTYYSDFAGRFGNVRRISDYAYSIALPELTLLTREGAETMENGVRLVGVSAAYGIEGADEVLVYLPGAPVSELPEEFLQWYCAGLSSGRRRGAVRLVRAQPDQQRLAAAVGGRARRVGRDPVLGG